MKNYIKHSFLIQLLHPRKVRLRGGKSKAGGELYAVSTQGQVTGFGAGNVDADPEIDKMDGRQ